MHAGENQERRAIVVGAGMAGLTVARALAGRFDQVTVLDRDRLPAGAAPRRGVPQGRHAHGLLARGADVLEELFPGLCAELVAAGAPAADWGERGRFTFGGHRHARGRLEREIVSASRPFLEAHVRRRLATDPAVAIVDGCEVLDVTATSDRRRVTGVRLRQRARDGGEEALAADLVVDCSGRKSRVARWLGELGYRRPPVDELRVDVAYASRQYRLPDAAMGDDVAVLIGTTPEIPRGGAMLRIEDDRWLVTLIGVAGETPPLDPDAYVPFAARLADDDIHAAISLGTPLDEPAAYRYPANQRTRYERLRRFPEGLLVAGDAVANFSPVYGQGMTVAALQAERLRDLLADGGVPSARRWFRAVAEVVKTPWELATGADLALPQIEGRRTAKVRLLNAYLARYHAAAAHDPVLSEQFGRVVTLLDPPERLLRPAVLRRVAGRGRDATSASVPAPEHAAVRSRQSGTP